VLDFKIPVVDGRPVIDRSEKAIKEASLPRASLLRASRRIHDEARIILYRVNEFLLFLGFDYNNPANHSIMSRPGFRVMFARHDPTKMGQNQDYYEVCKIQRCYELPRNMVKYMQRVTLNMGCSLGGIAEDDIVPFKKQTLLGPQRPTFRTLLMALEDVCTLLRGCTNLRFLKICIRSVESTPGSMQQLIEPLKAMRGIQESSLSACGFLDDRWVDWSMKTSYCRYLQRVMALPEGTEAPKYVGDGEEPVQDENDIFNMNGFPPDLYVNEWDIPPGFQPGDDDFDPDDESWFREYYQGAGLTPPSDNGVPAPSP
jgi:hypothetical protein